MVVCRDDLREREHHQRDTEKEPEEQGAGRINSTEPEERFPPELQPRKVEQKRRRAKASD